MKMNHALSLLFVSGILAFASGCQTSYKPAYHPLNNPNYANLAKSRVALQSVSDSRSQEPNVYYVNSENGDIARFDGPVAEFVREAIESELQRAGQTLGDPSSSTAVLHCDLLQFQASIAEPFMQSATLDLSVAIKFEWKDPKTGAVLGSNERSEHRSRKLGMGKVPHLASFDQAVLQDYGNEMYNDLLPRVIEKELCSISLLQQPAK
jgi:hypothetical protein